MKRKYAPAKLAFLIEQSGRSVYDLERELHEGGARLDRASIIRHSRGEQVPSVITLGRYADLFQVSTEFFYEVR